MWSARLFSVLVFTAMAGLSLPSLAAPAAPSSAKASSGATSKTSKTRPTKKNSRAQASQAGASRAHGTSVTKQTAAKKPAPARSVGSPSDGKLENGARLQSKPYLHVLATHKVDRAWGLPSLVAMLDRAAKQVERRYRGSVMGVGELSAKHGGDIHRHRSHESGRDADVAFYLVNSKGKPIPPRGLAKVERDLKASSAGGRFDVPRNWMLVAELLNDPKAHVSHIFVADPIRTELLDYARKSGASSELRRRAAFALMQPTGGLPHDDHFHVRISCPKGDATCVETAKTAPRKDAVATKSKRGRVVASAAKKAARKRSESTAKAPKPTTTAAPARSAKESAAASKPPTLMRGVVVSPDAAADAQEVKDFLDELGDLRITQ